MFLLLQIKSLKINLLNMRLKNGLYVLCCIGILSLTSCLGGEEQVDVILPDDAELTSFGLSHDSIPELAKVIFTIDQKIGLNEKGLIYNHDSMTYNTVIDRKVIVKYTNSSNITNVMRITEEGDSVWIASGDSLDVSQPLELQVFSIGQFKSKTYQFQLNIHQVDPDSIQYYQIVENADFLASADKKAFSFNGRFYAYTKQETDIFLYQSEDAKNWLSINPGSVPNDLVVSSIQLGDNKIYGRTENNELYVSEDAFDWVKIESEYPVIAVLGDLKKSNIQKAGLSVIVEKEGVNIFAIYASDSQEWDFSGTQIENDFPLAGFSVINHALLSLQYLTIVGESAVWSTQNGTYWAKINSPAGGFPLLGGSNAFLYDGEFYLINGKSLDVNTPNVYNKEVYYSTDRGVTWFKKPDKCLPPENYPSREGASLIVDEQGISFYIIGGRNETVQTDIWQVFLNKKTFVE
jgi:hypothetical protein